MRLVTESEPRPYKATDEQVAAYKSLVLEFSKNMKARPENFDDFVDKFARNAIEYTNGSRDLFKRALRVIIDTQTAYPSSADLKRVVDGLPKKMIDHIASGSVDARTPRGCSKCDFIGYLHAYKPDGFSSTICKCNYCRGRGLINADGLPTREQVVDRGYKNVKEKRE